MQYGFFKCITTSEVQKEFISKIMKTASIDILEPYISKSFTKQTLPPKPIIAIHTREQRDGINLIKSFYLKYPQFRWITFRDMRGLSELQFAETLKDCFLSVWVDPTSSFGTFPLESMRVGVPVVGQAPNLIPSWMKEENGIWIENPIQLVDIIADFVQNWIEDNIKPELYTEIEKTSDNFMDESKFENTVIELFESYIKTRKDSFESQLNKLKETVEA
jgi:glycosyltransferase involved in cell wall biosynthesis